MSHHIADKKTYFTVYVALMVLLFLTVGAAYVNLGPLNFPVTMVIAVIKAVMIVLIFMHVWWSERLTWIFSGAAFLWLAILIALTLNDYLTRDLLHIPGK
jgi:cytochrome c oxidase subunit IV